MGNTDSKQGKTSRRIDPSEVKNLASRLHVKSESDSVTEKDLLGVLGWSNLPNHIPSLLWKCLSKGSTQTKFSLILDLIDGLVYQDNTHSAKCLVNILQPPINESAGTYTLHLIKLFFKFDTPGIASWSKQGITSSDSVAQLLTDKVIGGIQDDSAEDLEEIIFKWLQKEPLLASIQRSVFCFLFALSSSSLPDVIPILTCQLALKPKPSLLDISDVTFINHSLPHDLQSEWSLLFSTRIHGMSFSSMLARLTNKGPTIFIVEDTKGHVFGGFASESWRLGPKFIGNTKCFVFKLRPFMAIYTSTGYNDHFMYLNHQQQTMPNGLGMGGQLNHFGLWIDADFGIGHSTEGCSTYYHMPRLSAEKDFTVENIEVWAVGPPPKEDSDDETDGKRSILDKDSGAKALLELVDRGHHSEGLREVPDETY